MRMPLNAQEDHPKVVSFDVDGTLVNQDFADRFWHYELPQLYATKHDIDFESALSTLREHYDAIGNEDIRWYLPAYWFHRFELENDPGEVLKGMNEDLEVYQDGLDVLERLRGQYELIVVSNASRVFLEVELENIQEYFSRVYSCVSDFGKVKKSPEVYERVCEDLNVKPQLVVHVGDVPQFDYLVPKSIGIQAFLIDRSGKREDALNSLLELPDRI